MKLVKEFEFKRIEAGQALLKNWDLTQSFLITSGRVSSEFVTKALRTGLSLIVSRSAAQRILGSDP